MEILVVMDGEESMEIVYVDGSVIVIEMENFWGMCGEKESELVVDGMFCAETFMVAGVEVRLEYQYEDAFLVAGGM